MYTIPMRRTKVSWSKRFDRYTVRIKISLRFCVLSAEIVNTLLFSDIPKFPHQYLYIN